VIILKGVCLFFFFLAFIVGERSHVSLAFVFNAFFFFLPSSFLEGTMLVRVLACLILSHPKTYPSQDEGNFFLFFFQKKKKKEHMGRSRRKDATPP